MTDETRSVNAPLRRHVVPRTPIRPRAARRERREGTTGPLPCIRAAVALLVGAFSLAVIADAMAANPRAPQRTDPAAPTARHDLDKSPLLRTAEHLGLLAGEAEHCRIEEDELDQFIALAHARLATMARNDPLSVAGARLEFSAYAALGRAEGPKEGCRAFMGRFRAARREIQ